MKALYIAACLLKVIIGAAIVFLAATGIVVPVGYAPAALEPVFIYCGFGHMLLGIILLATMNFRHNH